MSAREVYIGHPRGRNGHKVSQHRTANSSARQVMRLEVMKFHTPSLRLRQRSQAEDTFCLFLTDADIMGACRRIDLDVMPPTEGFIRY